VRCFISLDLSSLKKAVDALDRAIRVASKDIQGPVDTDREEVIRAGVIQNFELTYELCWKFMKRWLEANASGPVVDGFTMKELFRQAAERQLIDHVEPWFEYHQKRNKSSHTYDAATAGDVFETAVRFLVDARKLSDVLTAKND
jgi:nucleotidyltransferase substrate binding protein (TIGR01987 family)